MPKSSIVEELASYVPRHIRLGLPVGVEPCFVQKHDVVEEVPILNDEKRIVSSVSKHVLYDPKDTIGKFKASDFDIDMLQAAGVPLSIVNLRTPGITMNQIVNNLSQIENLEEVVSKVQAQNAERESWFNPKNVESPKNE